MNIKIITIHAMHNPGSVFQCYALQNYLEKNDCQVQIINYLPKYLFDEHDPVFYFIKQILFRESLKSRTKKFKNFIKSEFHLTKPCYNFDDLKDAGFVADLFLTGSDQLWNGNFICGRDPAYYLKFVENSPKASFSTSVGTSIIKEEHLENLKRDLSSFSYISVREQSTAKQLSVALGRKVEWVCDPVFLLDRADYQRFISSDNSLKEYVLVYLAPHSPQLDSIVAYFRSKGYKIILCGGMTKRCKCDLHIKDSGPIEFINLIANAKYVVSTSFHATAFCHIFHISFITIMPEGNNERIKSLIDFTELSSRGVDSKRELDMNLLTMPIDWEAVDSKIAKLINSSKDYLGKVISYIENDK